MARATADTHNELTKLAGKILNTGTTVEENKLGQTPEQRLSELERQAGLLPESGTDIEARDRRLARLRRVWGLP